MGKNKIKVAKSETPANIFANLIVSFGKKIWNTMVKVYPAAMKIVVKFLSTGIGVLPYSESELPEKYNTPICQTINADNKTITSKLTSILLSLFIWYCFSNFIVHLLLLIFELYQINLNFAIIFSKQTDNWFLPPFWGLFCIVKVNIIQTDTRRIRLWMILAWKKKTQ